MSRRAAFRVLLPVLLLGLALAATGCTHLTAVNPSFGLTPSDAKRELNSLRTQGVTLQRPVVFVGGFLDPFLAEVYTLHQLRRYAGDDAPLCGVSFVAWDSFDSCRRKLIDKVQRTWPSDDPTWTTEVDVVAFSMGGLVSRHAALALNPDATGPARRLKIARLFTIATPHRGATLAPLGALLLNSLARDMRAGSPLIQRLDETQTAARYPIIAYTRLGDAIVGAARTAPPGINPWWVSNRPFQFSHLQALQDPRLLADVLRQLNNQPSFTTTPPAPVP